VYGTLRDPSVRISVLGPGRDITTVAARLPGYDRQTASGFDYFFLVASLVAQVEGELLLGLEEADYPILDAYEDVASGLYQRIQVMVEAGPPPDRRPAWVYVKGPRLGHADPS